MLYEIQLYITETIQFKLQDIFYSRKNFARPELQLKPHRSFKQEVATLDKIFADGSAYCLGTMNQ